MPMAARLLVVPLRDTTASVNGRWCDQGRPRYIYSHEEELGIPTGSLASISSAWWQGHIKCKEVRSPAAYNGSCNLVQKKLYGTIREAMEISAGTQLSDLSPDAQVLLGVSELSKHQLGFCQERGFNPRISAVKVASGGVRRSLDG